jgi:Phage lysozyme.
LTPNQIETLLISDLKSSKSAANRIVGNLAQYPAGVQGVLVEMAFNLGENGLSKFKNFLAAVKAKKYKVAAKEMLNSDWSKQVGTRAKTLSTIVASS